MNQNLDERYNVAEEAIRGAFFSLLQEKRLEKINVSDVIKKAGIVRSTFYNHYENIPALISSIEDDTIEDIFNLMHSFHVLDDREICRAYLLTLCDYIMENPFLAELLRTARGTSFIEKMLKMMHRYVTETTAQISSVTHSDAEISSAITCAIGSTIGLFHKWTNEKFAIPKETIADVLTNIFVNSIFPMMS